jgi:hypothetical protein
MRKIILFLTCLLLATPSLAQSCDRDCLRGMITRYLDAMLKHDPGLLPLSPNVRFTEDHQDLKLGEGLWASIQGYGTFRQDVLDVRTGTAGTHVLAMENDNPVLVAIRLKLAGGFISEVETTVVRSREEGMIFNPAAIIDASAAMNVTPTPAQRNTREEMIALAMRYPEGLRIGSFVEAGGEFAPDTYRFENGQLMAGPGCTFFPGCERVREQSIPTLAGIQARVAAVDEEQGIVWLRMNFGPGSLMRGEGELSVWEMFKIYDGRITAIEAYMEEVPPGTPFGWDY